MRFLIRLFYVKLQRLFRKFFKTKQTESQKRRCFAVHLTPLKTDKEINAMIDAGMDVDKIIKQSYIIDVGDCATIDERYPEVV